MSTTPQWTPDLSPTPAWMARPGDKIGGTITELGTRVSAYSAQRYPIVSVRAEIPGCTEEGGHPIPPGDVRAFHGFRTSARNRLAELRPSVGEQIAIVHLGQATPGDSKSPFRYRIVMNRGAGDVDWASMAGPDELDEEIPPLPDEIRSARGPGVFPGRKHKPIPGQSSFDDVQDDQVPF